MQKTMEYARYTPAEHQVWSRLHERMVPLWRDCATVHFLEGLALLRLDASHIPHLDEINKFLLPRTGFRAAPVSGYVPAYVFFDSLRQRIFPTTVTIRPASQMDYLPEPDIFHDVCGHVPMHTNGAFADALVRFGECARAAARAANSEALANRIRALARFFWFTVEFGLMHTPGGLRAYGSGLLSSHGELPYSLQSADVTRRPLSLTAVINQPFEIDHYQPLLFVADSFEHLYELAGELRSWMSTGRLDDVAPGEPNVDAADLRSFLRAA